MKLSIATKEGEFFAYYSEHGLSEMDFPADKSSGKKITAISDAPAQVKEWHQLTTQALNDLLAGRAPQKLPPMDLSLGTEFQQQVWGALLRISFGRTQSYAEVAAAIGKPNAVRAVGGACGANPIPVLVPCHRVLAANHRLGGFTSGLDWKRKLLAIERVEIFETA